MAFKQVKKMLCNFPLPFRMQLGSVFGLQRNWFGRAIELSGYLVVYTKIVDIGGDETTFAANLANATAIDFLYPCWQAGYTDKLLFTPLIP